MGQIGQSMADMCKRITEYANGNPKVNNVRVVNRADVDWFDLNCFCASTLPVKSGISEVCVNLDHADEDEVAEALHGIADAISEDTSGLPKPYRVHMNDPWTVIEWEDGSKSKIKCHEEDTYNPLHGIIRNIIRKVGNNRVRVDAWEPLISQIADFIEGPEEAAFLEGMFYVLCEVMLLPGAMERLADYDVRDEEDAYAEPSDKHYNAVMEKAQEQIRQTIRNLVLDGEL